MLTLLVIVRFLPIYEYSNSRRRLPPDTTELIERSGMFKKAMGTVFKKAKLIGSVQVRIRYRFQDPEDAAAAVIEQWKHTLHTEQIKGVSKITSDIQQQQQQEQLDGSSDNQSTHDVIHPLDTHPRTSSEVRNSSSATITTNIESGGLGDNRLNNSSSTLVRESSSRRGSSKHINKGSANLKRPSSQSSKSSTNFKTNDNNSRSQHGRGDLARDETFINELFKNQLEKMMTANIPSKKQPSLFSPTGSSSSSSSGPSKSRSFRYHHRRWRPGFTKKKKKTNRRKRRKQRQQRQHNAPAHCMSFDWLTALIHPNKDEYSARGRRYGFQQNDMEVDEKGADKDIITSKNSGSTSSPAPATRSLRGQQNVCLNDDDDDDDDDDRRDEKEHGRACRLTHKAKKKARHIISSVDFGDKSFGSRWMQDSFEVVALAHPVADHLIGLAVKTQTQALVRAIIVLANSFVRSLYSPGAHNDVISNHSCLF